ncbi:MAG: hypothetical protein ACLFUS_12670 [Candidatus Sumerlaeia bacterium]
MENRKGWRLAIAAPRGAAKSTIKSLIYPLHAMLYQREKYIIILSATLKQAGQRLKNITDEILTNQRLQRYYPAAFEGKRKITRQSILFNECLLEIYSAGTEIRGISFRQWRPSLIILDDIEDSRVAHSIERRDRLWEWNNEVIENLGDSYTAIEIVGTILHPDSLLSRLIRRPDYHGRVFKSIERFADNQALWDQWKQIYTRLEDPDRVETARRFFNKNRDDMLRGARVSWHGRYDYYELMCQLVQKGRAAFFKELQNEPGSAEDAFFDMHRIQKFRLEGSGIKMLPGKEYNNDIA